MKKVLFVATVKQHILSFHLPYLKMFHDNNWEVHVACNEGIDKSSIPYCDVFYNVQFNRNPLHKNNIISYKYLKNIINENKYDIIHCHTPVGGVLARLAGRNCQCTKMIYTAHGFHFYKGAPIINWMVYYPIEYLCAFFTDVLITLNKEDYVRAKQFQLRNNGQIFYVPGIGLNLKKYDLRYRTIQREKFGLNPQDKLILTVGELIDRKNQSVIINALAKLKDVNYICYICGDGPLKEKLRNLIVQFGLTKKIKLLGFRSDIPDICLAADLFVFSSKQEGLPVALMEAMNAGLPIVCSDIRGNRDLVDDEVNGYLVKFNDINKYAEKINELLKDKNKCEKFSVKSLEKIKGFSIDVIINKMKKIYNL